MNENRTKVGGRPRLSDEEKRSKVIKFSCTKSEYAFFKNQAKNAGYTQVSRFVHDATVESISKGGFIFIEQSQVNAALVAELMSLGNNVNQATKALHIAGPQIMNVYMKQLLIAMNVIQAIRRELKPSKSKTVKISEEL
ncbi:MULTISPECIES: hypothetical protein [unclassified Agarivorans]|uniref:plasmid mobilization protein n=1 Tax=unclassified Agarivorans TaxID=2636026 RepID=UPI00200F2D8D|nr:MULTISPECIES: hypothetical protein [unclassified Agarivorans]MDO6766089.1 hypothetical protein [Agarivorans sp. 1_MG-2023]UPW20112.1 hypothetical protein M0C34_07580 [Agarivorans sp. TSD2052]